MQIIQKLVGTVIYSNIFIGMCAVMLALTNQLSVEGNMHFDKSLWFIFFSTMFTYSVLKFRGKGAAVTQTTHRNWVDENPVLSRNLLLISLIATVLFFFQLHGSIKLTVALLAAFTAFYGFVDIPFISPRRKLRDFGMFKTVFVAIVWSITTVVVPLADTFVEPQSMMFLLIRRFLFILALTIPFEIKDMADDREHSLKTLSLTFGVAKTKLIAQAVLIALILILIAQYFFFDISLSNMLAVNFSLLVSIACIESVKEETTDLWYYLVLDGMMIIQFAFVLIATKYF